LLEELWKNERRDKPVTMDLVASGVVKAYPNGKRANDGIELHVNRGETVGLVGPNGAGKTTFIRQILGLLAPTAGTIQVHGIDVAQNPAGIKGLVGYVPQRPVYFPYLTVRETLQYVLAHYPLTRVETDARIKQCLELVGLTSAENAYCYALSTGMNKLLLLAMALCQNTPLLVLDEPTAMVDVVNKGRVWQTLKALGKSTLLAGHDMAEIRRLCDRVYVLFQGKIIAEGSPQDIAAALSMPVEMRFVPADEAAAEEILRTDRAAYTYRRAGSTFDVELPSLDTASALLLRMSDSLRLEYLSIEGPSFEKAIQNMLGRDSREST